MREIDAAAITEAVARLCIQANTRLPGDVKGAIAAARTQGVDALLFGHTHEAFCDLLEDLWVMNPGSIGSLLSPTYGIIRITEAGMVCYTEAY